MGWSRVPYRERGYMRYAGLASIESYLKDARANLRQAQREVAWLEGLHALRCGQEQAGQWPARAADESDDGVAYWERIWQALEKRLRVKP